MDSWSGQSKGRVIGYMVFEWFIRNLGLGFAYFILRFVSTYYVFFSPQAFSSMFCFYHYRLGFNMIKAICCIFRNFYYFGQVLVDKLVVLGGFSHNLVFHLEGKQDLLSMEEGGILMSGHIGNWEVGGQVLDFLNKKINIIVFNNEKQEIKNYMSKILSFRNVGFIEIKDDLSHIIEMRKALLRCEIVAMHADRFIKGNRTVEIEFLGESAKFPLGPWIMAQYLQKPISYVFAIKETRRSYKFLATPPIRIPVSDRNSDRELFLKGFVEEYVKELEKIVIRYPLQWYNYYDFWKK